MIYHLARTTSIRSRRPSGAERGFTLIELMIVVGIIGILVMVAGPQYEKYQRKTRQSEAKLALSAMYSLQKSFYAEHDVYIPSFEAVGYTPEGSRRLYTHNACVNDAWAGSVSGYSGSTATTTYGFLNSPYTFAASYLSIASCSSPNWACSTYGNDPQTFNMIMIGQLATGIFADVWVISHLKTLRNCSPGY